MLLLVWIFFCLSVHFSATVQSMCTMHGKRAGKVNRTEYHNISGSSSCCDNNKQHTNLGHSQ